MPRRACRAGCAANLSLLGVPGFRIGADNVAYNFHRAFHAPEEGALRLIFDGDEPGYRLAALRDDDVRSLAAVSIEKLEELRLSFCCRNIRRRFRKGCQMVISR